MKCPVCRATYRSPGGRGQGAEVGEMTHSYPHPIPDSLNCHRCGVDLAPLIHLHDQALWYYRQAIQALDVGNYSAATTWNHQALALYGNNADFHALAGQLWALQGEFQQAIAAWNKARQLNPTHRTANTYLEELERVIAQNQGGDESRTTP